METDFLSLPLSTVLKEPARLKESIQALQNQFDESMARNYDYFIKTCENATTITDNLAICNDSITKLSNDVQKSLSLCQDLCEKAKKTVTLNSKLALGFNYCTKITDIMSIPQLMKSCKISSFPEEALQLFQTLDRFARQHPDISVVQSILDEARIVKAEVAQSLLDSFNGDLSLTKSVTIINLLRSADLHSEAELRVAFIKGRKQRMQQKIDPLPRSAPSYYFDRLTEVYRSSIFELCTQYKALFIRDDDEDDLTLHLFLHSEIQEYIKIFQDSLNAIDNESDAKAAVQTALYFGSSFTRLGFDFTPLIDNAFFSTKWSQ